MYEVDESRSWRLELWAIRPLPSHFVTPAGLMLVLLYGREGWFAPILRATGFNIVFAFPGPSLHQPPPCC